MSGGESFRVRVDWDTARRIYQIATERGYGASRVAAELLTQAVAIQTAQQRTGTRDADQ